MAEKFVYESPEDVRKDLLDLVRRFGEFAEETAASPDVTAEDKKLLAQEVEQLCGSEEDVEPPGLPSPGAVQDLIQIIEDYEAFRLWLVDVFPRLSVEDQAALRSRLGPFIPEGAVHLRSVLLTGFNIGVFAPNPIQKARDMRKARDKRHPGSDEKKAIIAKMHKQGSPRCKIAQAVGISEAALNWRLSEMFAAGELQKRSRRGRPKINNTRSV
jgi:hypothetical protein